MVAVITKYTVNGNGERLVHSQVREFFECAQSLCERLQSLGLTLQLKDAIDDLQRDVVHYNIPVGE